MIFYSDRKLKIGQLLIIGQQGFFGPIDFEGIRHEMNCMIIKESNKKEFLNQFIELEIEIWSSTLEEISRPNTYFYECSID